MQALHRPAVAPVAGDICLGHCCALAIPVAQRAHVGSSRSSLVECDQGWREGGAGGCTDRRILAAQQFLCLGTPGHQLAVQQQPVGLQLLPEIGTRGRIAHTRQQRLLQSHIVEEAPPGAGSERVRLRSWQIGSGRSKTSATSNT